MDLISIFQALWRRRFFAIPVLVLTAILAIYTVKIKPPTYAANASMLLTNPPGQPTQSQIASDPSLKVVSPYNTFVSYGDLRVVANTVMDLINAPSSQAELAQVGVSPNYTLALSTDYGNPPIITITGVGKSPQAAIASASGLALMVKKDLNQVQTGEGVNPFYAIGTLEVVKPTVAVNSSAGKLRSLISVFGVGIVLLFLVVSVADVLDKRRKSGTSLTAGFARVGGRRYPRNTGDDQGPRAPRINGDDQLQRTTYDFRTVDHGEPRYPDWTERDDSRDARRSSRDADGVTRDDLSYRNASASRQSSDVDRQQQPRAFPAIPTDYRRD
jgi:capsular polysaccharide biosynthesis protein